MEVDKSIGTHNPYMGIELNEVNILLKLIRQSMLVTILSEATIHNEEGIKAVPLDFPGNEMHGCVHVLRNTYCKHSMQEFIRLLREANAVKERIHDWRKPTLVVAGGLVQLCYSHVI